MRDPKKMQKIRDLLFELYSDSLPKERLVALADDIYDSAYVPEYGIADIFPILYEEDVDNEECGENFRIRKIFHAVVDDMEDNALTARKLYDCLTNNLVDFDLLCKLLNRNREWLTAEQIKKVKEPARCFDREILKISIRDWDDDE